MTRLLHIIFHWFGLNKGRVETWWDGDKLMVGFRCECGALQDVGECKVKFVRREKNV